MTRRKTKTDHSFIQKKIINRRDLPVNERRMFDWVFRRKNEVRMSVRFLFHSFYRVSLIWRHIIHPSLFRSVWMNGLFFLQWRCCHSIGCKEERARTHTDEKVLFANVESLQLVEFDMDRKNRTEERFVRTSYSIATWSSGCWEAPLRTRVQIIHVFTTADESDDNSIAFNTIR